MSHGGARVTDGHAGWDQAFSGRCGRQVRILALVQGNNNNNKGPTHSQLTTGTQTTFACIPGDPDSAQPGNATALCGCGCLHVF